MTAEERLALLREEGIVIRALCWKEYREHRLVWLLLAALTVLLVGSLAALVTPLPHKSALRHGLLFLVELLAVAYGLMCGALMLAGEREAGTLSFLDTVAGRRGPLWTAKALIGGAFSFAQGLILALLVAAAGMTGPAGPAFWFLLLPLLALDGYAWGLAGSAFGRSAFAAALLGALLLAASWVLTGLLAVIPGAQLILASRLAFVVVGVEFSRRVFCEPDRERRARPANPEIVPRGPAPWRALVWLSLRQGKWEAGLVLGLSLPAGLLLPLLDPLAWPLAVLLAGVVCGTTIFGREQEEGSYRFLGDQRLPAGQVWAVKTVCWLGVALAAAWLVLLGVGLFHGQRLLRSTWSFQFGDLVDRMPGNYLQGVSAGAVVLLGLAYGFAVGQLAALVLHRRLVALVAAVVVSSAAVAVWLPSLLLGGLPRWQFLVPPLLLLVAGRLVVSSWVGGRLATVRPVALLLGGVLLAGLWTAGALANRVAEIPAVEEPFDRAAFEASLPSPAQNKVGPLILTAAQELREHEKRVTDRLGTGQEKHKKARTGFANRLWQVAREGWPAQDKELGQWLDAMFAAEWPERLRRAAALPPGMVQDPRGLSSYADSPHLFVAYRFANLLTARALQIQARGDRAAALDHLLTALGVTRQLRSKAPLFDADVARMNEPQILEGLERWLERVGPNRELLRRALDGLTRHERELPPLAENVKVEYYLTRNRLDEFDRDQTLRGHLYEFARQVPWEREREQRLLNALFASLIRRAELPYPQTEPTPDNVDSSDTAKVLDELGLDAGAPWAQPLAQAIWRFIPYRYTFFHTLPQARAVDLCRVRAARLQVALALYEVEQGKPAARLADLVPRYLPEVPTDPFSGRPFGYRISTGERIDRDHQRPALEVRPGQGVLWSAGLDGTDQGGRKQGALGEREDPGRWGSLGLDAIFVVPRWPER